jgi:hypothetical protein
MSLWEYRARLVAMHDADTGAFLLDVGLGIRAEVDLRLVGVRAPELSQDGGQESLAYANEWMSHLSSDCKWPLLVRTERTTSREPDERRSFTRYLADVHDITPGGRHLNADVNAFLAEHPEWPRGQ